MEGSVKRVPGTISKGRAGISIVTDSTAVPARCVEAEATAHWAAWLRRPRLCIEWSPAENAKSKRIRTRASASMGCARGRFTDNTHLPLRRWRHCRRRVMRRRMAAIMFKGLEVFEVTNMAGRHELGEEG